MSQTPLRTVSCWVGAFILACACGCVNTARLDDQPPKQPAAKEIAPAEQPSPVDLEALPGLSRRDFNRIAALLDLPLFWAADEDNDGKVDPAELKLLGVGTDRAAFVAEDGFTPAFGRQVAQMVEYRRREAVARELNQGRPTLVHSNFTASPEPDRRVVEHITRAARIIEELYALQNGSFALRNCLTSGDTASRAAFRRNQSPWCVAPDTMSDPFCNACPFFPPRLSGLYPAALAAEPDMCERLAAHEDAKRLLDPFCVVREAEGRLVAVPYHEHWAERMGRIAAELEATAAALPAGKEKAFRKYLLAAARGFETNDWQAADEAWAAMSSTNSRWYLRIGPDEVYKDPCNRKAMFHTSFARVDPDSLYWQEKLVPLRQEMETRLAELIGPSYEARQVEFQMPDFIAIILNAGDARLPLGALVGQSLPNWGKVATEGRGRTVVMSNLYTDPDSQAIDKARGDALLSSEAMQAYTREKRLGLLDIILHEATHNLGPHSDYAVDGKKPDDIFGGVKATILEELKAQTGALYYVALLREKGVLGEEDANKVYNHAIRWAFGHISRGMTDDAGRPKPYSQVAAIHIVTLVRAGAMTWEEGRPAANGTDNGRFAVEYAKIPQAMKKLMQQTGRLKATGNVEGAKKLIASCLQGSGFASLHADVISERIRRYPKASFVYGVEY